MRVVLKRAAFVVGAIAGLWLWPFIATVTVIAQEEPAKPKESPWIEMSFVDVAPARVDEFLAVERELSARAGKAKVPWRVVSRTEAFGDPDSFLIATPLDRLAVLDKKGDADPDLQALLRRVRECVTRVRTYAVHTFADIDHPLPEGESQDLMVVNVVRVFPGREQDYLDVMSKDVLPHFNEAGGHHLTGSLALGGESGFIHLFYVKNFAELDKGSPVMRALGPEGAQAVTAKLAGVVSRSELWVTRVVAEASHLPSPSTTEK